MRENERSGRPARRRKRRTSKTIVVMMIIIVLLLLALIGMMITVVIKKAMSPEETLPPVTTIATEAPSETTEVIETTIPTEPVNELHQKVIELNAANPDVVGWVKIGDTKVDCPVVFTPEDEQKYLYKDIEGKSDVKGTPLIDDNCSLNPRTANVIIHGHNMAKGDIFHTLLEYEKKDYWEKYPTITYVDVDGEHTYEIFGAFYDRVYKKYDTNFKFYQFIDPATEDEFNEGIKYFTDLTSYDTGVDVKYGDNLLMLVTCAYHVDNGRFVVVAREVTE